MNIEEFIKNIAEQTDQDPSILSAGTKMRDIEGWSSLEGLFVMLMIDDVYKVSITGDDFTDSLTIEDLFDIIKSRQ